MFHFPATTLVQCLLLVLPPKDHCIQTLDESGQKQFVEDTVLNRVSIGLFYMQYKCHTTAYEI